MLQSLYAAIDFTVKAVVEIVKLKLANIFLREHHAAINVVIAVELKRLASAMVTECCCLF